MFLPHSYNFCFHCVADNSSTIIIAASVASFFTLVIIIIVAVVVYRKCCRKDNVEVDVSITAATKTSTEQNVNLPYF